jgi:hypothetical protein
MITPKNTLDFIESLSVGGIHNKIMSSAIAKILKNTDHIKQDQEVVLFAISYISDFDLKVSDTLAKILFDGAIYHMDAYSLKDLSYLLVSLQT